MSGGVETLARERILGCILAGGQSRRMGGGDKCLIDIGGTTMLDLVVERLAPQVPGMILNANGDPDRFARFGLGVAPDTVGGFAGPLAGILAGMTFAETQCDGITHIVSVAADTPFFPETLVEDLRMAVPGDRPVIALASSSDKLHPVCGLWPVALREDLQHWLSAGNSGKVLAFVDRHDSVEVAFGIDGATGLDPFFNANHPDDLDTVRSIPG